MTEGVRGWLGTSTYFVREMGERLKLGKHLVGNFVANVRYVMVREPRVPAVLAAGYEEVFALDGSYRLLKGVPAAKKGSE